MPDASPTKWHLAHTTWFFETFVLEPGATRLSTRSTRVPRPVQLVLRGASARSIRARSAACSRGRRSTRCSPTARTSTRTCSIGSPATTRRAARSAAVVELGLHHEQQHQELILTDVKHLLGANPLRPAYRRAAARRRTRPVARSRWRMRFAGGVREIGASADAASRSTTSARATACCSRRSRSRRAWSTNGEYARLHRRRRLSPPRAVAVRRLGRRCSARLATRPLYWERSRRRLARVHPRRPAPARSADEPVVPRQLLRGRRLRALGRRAPADRGRVGSGAPTGAAGRAATSLDSGRLHPRPPRATAATPAPALRRRLGVDAQRLRALPRLPPARRRARRVQRQVHVQPAGAARRLLRHAARPHPRELPQLLPARRALAVQRHPPGEGRVAGARYRFRAATALVEISGCRDGGSTGDTTRAR